MLDIEVDRFFASLEEQITEGVIIEDDEDLAAVARLVPFLCEVVARTVPETEASEALKRVNTVICGITTV